MPLFITDEELERCSNNPRLIAEKADTYIIQLQRQIETLKAQSDASSITSEQTCALLEQKYISLSSDFSKLESQNSKLTLSIDQHLKDLAQLQSQNHQLHLTAISKDGEVERLSTEVTELHKSKRQLLELVEQKDSEISEKNATIKTYLDKIVNLTDDSASKQAHLRDTQSEMARSNATCARLLQEKELIQRHNVWLNEELTVKVSETIQLRTRHAEVEEDLSTKLADVERQFNECSRSLRWNKERVKELEEKLTSLQEELCSSKETNGENEARFSAEILTVTKLVELYKESSEEWSRKAGELEGVIKALEMHLSQLESDYKEKLQKEESARKMHEKEAAELKEKLDKCEAEIENHRKANELSLLPISSFTGEIWTCRNDADDVNENDHLLLPNIPVGVSGTALAASLLRDGWSLAKMYEKYQEAVDALRHETMGRKQSQAILERVLYEIEEKAEVILDERAEHERMAEAYSVINQKLQQSVSEQNNLQGSIQGLKADLRRSEREYDMAQKEIIDLQKQVTVLLKECRDIQLRCGSASDVYGEESAATISVQMKDVSDTERVISERLLTFRDINELVGQNVQLRSLVRSLSEQIEKRDSELREMFEVELQKQTDEAACKVAAVLKRAEEQGRMIESLHSAVAMYKRLYEEELKLRASHPQYSEAVPETGRKNLMLLEDSQDAYKKANEQAVERAKILEEELDKSRSETISLRLERDKLVMEANFARDKLDSFIKEFEHQRDETNGIRARNVEFSQLIVDYQRKIRESSDSLHAAEELSRKLTMEVSLLKHVKELLVNSEKRASDEVSSLSQRVHQLQASMDTIHSAEEVREEAKVMEMRKQEEYLKKVERDWAQVKKELQEERDNVRTLTLDREQTMKNALRQVEDLGKQLADALRSLASAESRAAVAEARYSDLEEKIKSSRDKVVDAGCEPSTSLLSEVTLDLPNVKEEMAKLKEEAQAYKDHMLQYKNIAQVNEVALKQIEFAHEQFKTEADKMKKSLEAEILSMRERFSALESISTSKSNEAASAIAGKEEALSSALAEITSLKEERSVKMSEIMGMEVQISSVKEDLEKEHLRWRTAQNNYERQVILQSETIQELTKTSQVLALLQEEVSQLRKLADSQKSENDILKEKLESEKSVLGKLKDDAERKYNEVNEQNKILHARVEALHIKLAEKERLSAGTSGSTGPDVQGDDMQTVVSYLRRSKEIAETEISLLKQEKLRLQSQLESALKASETAQAQLHTERANSRALLFSDEDFKSLQIQVREMNLLRESNLQLREENKYNFEECQKLREVAQKARVEMEHLQTMVREKEIEVDSCKREIEMQKIEIKNLEIRIVELLGACKNVELEEYSRLKDDYQKMQANLRVIEAELDETRKLVSEKQNSIACLEHDLAKTRTELTEKERRIKESLVVESNLKSDLEKQRKQVVLIKKKFENFTKEKEELSKEKQTLSKQLEDCKQGKRHAGDTSSEHTKKEIEVKDARIQILEKHLEKVKEQNKQEKKKRMDNEKAVWDCVKNVNVEKTKLVDELERHKLSRENLLESGGAPIASSTEPVLENLSASYLKAVDNLEVAANSYVVGPGARSTPSEASTMNTSSPAAQQVPAQSSNKQLLSGPVVAPSPIVAPSPVVAPSQARTTDERDKRSNLPKPVPESRKGGRVRLVRPRLDPETVEAEKSSITKEKIGVSHDTEPQVDLTLPTQPSARKRSASTSGSELHEDSLARPDTNSIVVSHVSKKSRGSDFPLDSTEGYMSVPPQSLEQPAGLDESFDGAGVDHTPAADEMAIVAEKEELHASSDMEDESKESVSDAVPKGETPINEIIDTSEDLLDNTREVGEGFDEGLMDGVEQDPQETTVENDSDREEGELPPDVADEQDGRDISCMMTSTEPVEVQHELAPVPDVASSAIDEDLGSTVGDLLETTTSDVIMDEKTDTGEGVEETAEDSDKSDTGGDQGVVETDTGAAGSYSPSNPSDLTVSEQDNLTATPVIVEESSPVTRSRILNLAERAEANAAIRQAGIGMVSQTSTRRGKPTAPGPKKYGTRGRGRGRGGRGPTPDKGRG